MTVMQQVSISWLTIAGILVSSLSAALGALFGGSRILQAMARDDIFPGTKYFAYGTPVGDEPRNAVLFTWAVAQVCCLVGNLDVIAQYISLFFLQAYATVNLCCFLLQLSGSINFRPQFHLYSRFSSLLGFIICCIVMFLINYKDAAISLLVLFAIFFYLNIRDHKVIWGEVTNSILFHQVRKYLLRMDEKTSEHSKLWRPSVIFIVDDLGGPQLDFCNVIKKGGLYVIGVPLVGDIDSLNKSTVNFRDEWLEVIKLFKLKAFPSIACGLNIRDLYYNLSLSSGLGALKANMVVMNLPGTFGAHYDDSGSDMEPSSVSEIIDGAQIEQIQHGSDVMRPVTWVQVIIDQGNIHKNTIILANFKTLNPNLISSPVIRPQAFKKPRPLTDMFLDIFVNVADYTWGGKRMPECTEPEYPDLLLQLAYILKISGNFKRLQQRLIVVDDNGDSKLYDKLMEYMQNARVEVSDVIRCTLKVNNDDEVGFKDLRPKSAYWREYKKKMKETLTSRTQFVLMKLPFDGDLDEANEYVDALQDFVSGLPPMAMVKKGEQNEIISMDI